MYHPFIINMNFSFQDDGYLYIETDLLTGVDLCYYIYKNKKFFEEQTNDFLSRNIISLFFIFTQKKKFYNVI